MLLDRGEVEQTAVAEVEGVPQPDSHEDSGLHQQDVEVVDAIHVTELRKGQFEYEKTTVDT